MNNGKADPRLAEAQRQTELARKPLDDATKRAGTTHLRLEECRTALALAEKEYEEAQNAYVEDDGDSNRVNLHLTHAEAEAAKSRVQGFMKKFAVEQAAVAPLQAAYDAAMGALAEIQADINLAHLEDAWSEARHALVTLEAQLEDARLACVSAERRYKELAAQKRDGVWKRQQKASLEHFSKNNPNVHGYQRTRTGFGL
jgi:chromosome segregation ATPase